MDISDEGENVGFYGNGKQKGRSALPIFLFAFEMLIIVAFCKTK